MKKSLPLVLLTLFLVGTTVSAAPQQSRRVFPGRRPAPPRRNAQPRRTSPSQRPSPEQRRLDDILRNWEARGAQIRTLRAKFSRLYYDAVFGERDPKTGKIVAQRERGELAFQAPDKGIFRVYVGEEPPPFIFPEKDKERWVCTGTEVYQYDNRDARRRQVTITPLPPELQGHAISEGPLPFIFGMKAEQAKRRYGLRLVPLGGLRRQDVCIEVTPKRQEDLANFSRALVVLDTEVYLPRAIQVEERRSAPAGDPASKPVSRYVYFFYVNLDRAKQITRSTIEVNPRINERDFVNPPTRGYRVIRNDALLSDATEQPAADRSSAQSARRGGQR